MKVLRILVALFVIAQAFVAWGAENIKGEALAVLRLPAGMELTEESLKNGEARKFIESAADTAGGKVKGIYESLSLINKDGNIFAFIVSDSKTSDQLIAALKAVPGVISASPNRTMKAF